MTFKMPIISKDEMAQRFQQNWLDQNPDDNCLPDGSVDDCLTNLNWLQNLNIMTKIGAPTPETPPASPVPSPEFGKGSCSTEKGYHGSCHSSQSKAKSNANKVVLEDIDYKTNGTVKPPYSYATLICMAMKANKNKMTLSAIYKWIKENFLYYKNADPSWQNSIRHNLSLNKCFIKIPRSKDEPGKGGFWRLDPEYAESLVDGIFKKRRPAQRQPGRSSNSRKNRKEKTKEPPEITVARALETFQDTPPNSAGSIVSNSELDLMVEMKSLPVVSSPSQQHFAYATVTQGICEYPGNAILTHQPNPQIQRSQVHPQAAPQQQIVGDDEVLMTLEPIQTIDITANASQAHLSNGLYQENMCWSEVLDSELELDSLYKYRPEDSISTVVNTALALNDDLFSSDGSAPDLPNELDLASACSEHLDIGGNTNNNALPPSDWWACFQNTPLDVSLTPLLSISVPFTNTTTTTNHVINGGGIVYPQNATCPITYNSMVERQMSLQDAVNEPWADCKVALEAAALDLDDLGDLDTVHAY